MRELELEGQWTLAGSANDSKLDLSYLSLLQVP